MVLQLGRHAASFEVFLMPLIEQLDSSATQLMDGWHSYIRLRYWGSEVKLFYSRLDSSSALRFLVQRYWVQFLGVLLI